MVMGSRDAKGESGNSVDGSRDVVGRLCDFVGKSFDDNGDLDDVDSILSDSSLLSK